MCHNSSFMRNSIIKAETDSRLAEYRISDEVLQAGSPDTRLHQL